MSWRKWKSSIEIYEISQKFCHASTDIYIYVDFVLYDAGVDVHKDDELGYLKLTNQGIYERDFFILNLCKNLSLPVACVIGGGYRNNHQDLVPAHLQLFKAALEVF